MLNQMEYRIKRYNLGSTVTPYMHQHVEYFVDSVVYISYIIFD